MASKSSSVYLHQVHVGVKYRTLRFPLDPRTVAHFIVEKGWIIPPEMATMPLGGQLGGSGLLGIRGPSQIRFNTDSKVISVVGRDEQQVVSDLEELESVIRELIDFDSQANAEYYELISEGYASLGRSALESWKSFTKAWQHNKEFDDLFGESASLFGIHLMRDASKPGDVEWWDLSLAVQTFKPEKYHAFRLVRRSADRTKVVKTAKDIKTIVRNALGKIENMEGK